MKKNRFLLSTLITGFFVIALGTSANAAEAILEVEESFSSQSSEAIQAYWTQERLDSAVPIELPAVIVDEFDAVSVVNAVPEGAVPGLMPGWAPGSGPQPTADDFVSFDSEEMKAAMLAQPQHGTKPTVNPRTATVGPFQRWTHFGRYLSFPRSIHGKYFFTLNGSNYVCSATVQARNMLITAGHCNSDGNGTWATNRIFYPSYNNSGINPARGGWTVINSAISTAWHNNADPDYDYSCLITNSTGTTISNNIGNVTGWAGWAVNWPARQPIMQFGYPSQTPFQGRRIITAATSEWYTHDFRSGGQVSKFIGSDMTKGSSGGSWLLSWNHRTAEYADTDGLGATDPATSGGPHVNGVNSHKRCWINCNYPPSNTTGGVFWQEMSSPPFLSTAAGGEYKDVYDLCASMGGT